MTPTPDPDTTMTEAQAFRKCLSDFHAFAAAHDPGNTATLADDLPATLEAIHTLQIWLHRCRAALERREW